jgi:hypothetical protein
MLPPQGEKSHCKFGSITISRWGAFDQASCRRIATPKSRGRERWIALGVPAFLVVSAGARTKAPDFSSAHSSPARTAIHSTEIKQHAFANTTNNNAAYRERGSLACFDLHKSRLLGNAPLTAIFRRTFSLIGTLSVQEIRKCPLNEATTLLGFGPTRRSRVVLSVRCPRAAPRRYSFAKRPVTFRGDSYG